MSSKKIRLDGVTLVTVTSVHIKDTIDALRYNLRGMDFESVKFISDIEPKALPHGIEFCRCDKITNLDEYSRFMIYDLRKYIDTPHCLTIHRDGVIVNPRRWRNEFLQYDYIGAPWPIDDAFRDPSGISVRVGNGGFSLRSKRLLECAAAENIPFASDSGCLHEDVFICVQNRARYEKAGIRFADLDCARFFAHEMRVPEIKGIRPFGFHKYRKQNRFYPRFPSSVTRFLRKILGNTPFA